MASAGLTSERDGAAARPPPHDAPPAQPRYWAFLSYSHADARWADWLHRRLETFAVPRRFVGSPTPGGPAPARFRPIFRDEAELGAAPDLDQRLREALAGSAFLIVICSPAATASSWVDAEIRHFKALHGDSRVLAVIVAGSPMAADDGGTPSDECFPLALRRQVGPDGQLTDRRIEVIAADLRPRGDGRRLAVLRLMSGLLGVGLDRLIQREAQRRQTQLMALTAASLAGATVLAGLTATAVSQRDAARRERAQAEGLVEFMVGDLRARLEPAGRLDVMDSVAARALAYYTAQENRGLDASSLGRRARVLHLLGDIRDRRGDTRAAQTFFEEAARSTRELLARRPNDPHLIFDDAQSVFWLGYLASQRGHDDAARRDFLEYQRLADRLVAIEPANRAWQAEVGYANGSLGTVLLVDGRADEASTAFQRQLDVLESLARAEPGSRSRQMDLGQGHAWLADAETDRGRFAEALAHRLMERAIYLRLEQQGPGDSNVAVAMAVNTTRIAKIHMLQGLWPQALGEARSAVADFDRLMVASPDDTSLRNKATLAIQLLAQVALLSGDSAAAESASRRALTQVEALVRRDPTVSDWSGPGLGGARVLTIRIAAAQAVSDRARRDALRPSLSESARLSTLSAARPDFLALARVASEADLLAGDFHWLDGDAGAARAAWQRSADRMAARAAGLPPGDRGQVVLRQARWRLAQVLRAPPARLRRISLGYVW